MPDPITSRPFVCQTEDPETIELEPMVIVASPTAKATKQPDLAAPYTGAEVRSMLWECASELDSFAIAALAAAPVAAPVAVLGALKLAIDLDKCAEDGHSEVMRQRESVACRLEGGIPLLTADHRVHCDPAREP
jgi:hypothetical protein